MTIQSVLTVDAHPPRTILAVVTVGRYTCATPIIEICRVLHERGHTVHFACLDGWQKLATPHSFISKIHVVGRDLTVDEDVELYRLLDASNPHTSKGRRDMFAGLTFMMSWWPETYANVKALCQRERPDFILADLLADACVDVAKELKIPLAAHFPQMPVQMLPTSYIPGAPGLQLKHLTTEHASVWDRMLEEVIKMKLMFAAGHYILERNKMRRAAGVNPSLPPSKPDYLIFVNNFFGLEAPRDLPPLVCPIGPVLAKEFPPLPESGELATFLQSHKRVMYVSFGSHLVTPAWRMQRLIQGTNAAIKSGDIDGVIWAMKVATTSIEDTADAKNSAGRLLDPGIDFDTILQNRDPNWLIQAWVPQRAILNHPSTCLYLAHGGASSTMEAAYHGVPVIAMSVYADQLGNSKRLETAGVALRLDKNTFSTTDLSCGVASIIRDLDGSYARNVLRLRRIAVANSQRKHLAAQMIEEVIYDHELRFEHSPHGKEWVSGSLKNGVKSFSDVGRELRPMHLQTCDSRMSWVKRNNVDMWILFPLCLPVLLLSSWFKWA